MLSQLVARYAYARVTIVRESALGDRVELIAGVEIDRAAGETSRDVRYALRHALEHDPAVKDAMRLMHEDAIVREAERLVRAHWPNRSYFFEVGNDDYVQVFEPKALALAHAGVAE